MFVVLMAVFSFVFASDPDLQADLIVGLFLWDFFAECDQERLASLQAKGFLLTKARCRLDPRRRLDRQCGHHAVVFAVVIVMFLRRRSAVRRRRRVCAVRRSTSSALTLIVVGFSLATSVLFLRYRDLNQVWDMVTQAGFFLAPVIYPLGIIPERFHL